VTKSLFCPMYTSFGAFSQCFLARKIFTLRFHCCESHILQKPPLVPMLGDKPTSSSKSRKSHLVILPRIFVKLEKITCYSTNPTYISPVIYAVSIVTHFTNRSLRSLAGTTTVQNSTYQVLVHFHTIIKHPTVRIP
jgi:hypothetical protein